MDGRTLCVLKDTEKATGMSAACIGDGRDGAKSSQLEIQLFSPLILRPGCLSNLESKKANPCPDLAKDPPGVRSRRVTRGRYQCPVSPGSSHLDGACYNHEGRMNGILISLKANCPGAQRKSVLSLDRPKSPDEANKTVTLPVPMSSLPQGRKFVLSLHRPKSPDKADKTATLPVPMSSLPQGRAIKIGKRRLLADASPGPGSLPQRPQKNRASVGHPSPALTYSKPARMASLQGG